MLFLREWKLCERIQEETGMSKLKIFNLSRIGFNTRKCWLGSPQLVQESCARIEPGAMAKNRPISASHGNWPRNPKDLPMQDTQRKIYPGLTRLKFLILDVLGLEVPIQSKTIWFVVSTCFNPLKIIIYSSRFISSIEMEIQIPKAIPKIYHLQPAATFFLRIANPGCPQVRGPKPLVIGAVLGGKRCHATGCPNTIKGCIK